MGCGPFKIPHLGAIDVAEPSPHAPIPPRFYFRPTSWQEEYSVGGPKEASTLHLQPCLPWASRPPPDRLTPVSHACFSGSRRRPAGFLSPVIICDYLCHFSQPWAPQNATAVEFGHTSSRWSMTGRQTPRIDCPRTCSGVWQCIPLGYSRI